MKAKDLQSGQAFHLPGKRKFRTVKKVFECDPKKGFLDEHKGKLLIVLDDCRQMILDPDTEVMILNRI